MSGDSSDDKDAEANVIRVDFGARSRTKPGTPRDQITKEIKLPTPAGPPGQESKLDCFRRLIDRGLVLLTFDTRHPEARVPPAFRGQPQLALSFSLRFGVDDFAYDHDGVRGTLSFQRRPFFCEIPWDSVYMMRSEVADELLVWPEGLPPEVADQLPPQLKPEAPRRRPVLAAVPPPNPDDAHDHTDNDQEEP
jgi:hypothetical protein